MFTSKLLRMCRSGNLFSSVGILQRNFALATNYISKDDKRDFLATFPDVVKDLTKSDNNGDIPHIKRWFSKVLQYNLSGGKRVRGLTTVYSYRILSDDLSDANVRLSYVLGWCIEMLQSYFLVMDDVMDNSDTRRGKLSWHKLSEVGVPCAINDGLLLESGMYELLKLHFRNKPYYVDIVELFHDIAQKTQYGQTLDLMTGRENCSTFTMNKYDAIVKYKTAYYSFYLPVAGAMHMAGINDPEVHEKAKRILLKIGKFYQVQDDFIDSFGNPDKTGKSLGTDVREGKCTWLAVVALEKSTPQQRELFQNCFGSDNPEDIQQILDLYAELDVPTVYKAYEESTFTSINKSIQQLDRCLPKKLFYNILETIFKRTH